MKKLISWTYNFTLFIFIPLALLYPLLLFTHHTQIFIHYTQMFDIPQPVYDISSLPLLGKLLFFCLESISAICLLFVLWYFLQILKNSMKTGYFFSFQTITMLKKINRVGILWTVYSLFFDTFASVLISFFKPAGFRYISFSINAYDIIHLFGILLIMVLIHIIQEGCSIKSEQDLVV
ncbi:MAG: DUF2975 domain-containing protein [Candidatus Babeliales bacterium]